MNAETKDTTDDRSTMIFVHSILPGELYDSFVDDMPKTLMEARTRAEKHIHLEDAKALKAKAKQEVASPQAKKGEAPKTDSNTPRRSFRDQNFSPSHGKRKFEGESPRPLLQSTSSKKSFRSSAIKVSSRTAANASHRNPARTPPSFANSTSVTAIFSSSAALFGHSSTST
ncbi:hypothetical protein AXF42_Ash007356 [Apostasia shenzhenica]|uniref:Uncharacterized protein n=1 Tax=Apostasia shenzhenica TaxID=1088818 RepID=A0A2I0B9Y6_9ASPA|nr:hypothetical protein AXF42_Ash007356 [Apostasia shenzhenica]